MGNLGLANKFRNSYPKMLHENTPSKNFRTLSRKSPILMKSGMKNCNYSKAVLYYKCFLTNFLKCLEQPSVEYLMQLVRILEYLNTILDTWIFHQFISIYHNKYHNCSQVYTVHLATSFYWISLLLLCLIDILETMCRLMHLATRRLIDSHIAT